MSEAAAVTVANTARKSAKQPLAGVQVLLVEDDIALHFAAR